jgi:purine-binding chemotaxis protein CheW
MSRSPVTATRSQLALESYLDGLLRDAASELAETIPLDEFEAAVLEEQVRDSRLMRATAMPASAPAATAPSRPLAEAVSRPLVLSTFTIAEPLPEVVPVAEAPQVVEPVVEQPVAPAVTPPAAITPVIAGRPVWAEEPFECLLFEVAGLTLAVPLVCLGTIYPLQGEELTSIFGQPDWFLGILPSQGGNLKVLDTARWVMPDRYRDDFRDGLQYVISVEGYDWGLAVHQVSRSIRLDPTEVKWRSQRTQRPWLAGTVIEHMCALLDVAALAELIASGATRNMQAARAL